MGPYFHAGCEVSQKRVYPHVKTLATQPSCTRFTRSTRCVAIKQKKVHIFFKPICINRCVNCINDLYNFMNNFIRNS